MRRKALSLATFCGTGFLVLIIGGLVLLNGCGKKEDGAEVKKEKLKAVVSKGDKVKVQYKGTLPDGQSFDQSREGEPLEFTVGSGDVIAGFENAVVGMKLNEEKEVTIPAAEAYGLRDESRVQVFPKSFFPENFNAEKGLKVTLQDQRTRRPVLATITEVKQDSVVLDLNHPLADMDLTFNIKVVDIQGAE